MDRGDAVEALRQTGRRLPKGTPRVRIILTGAIAGMLLGRLDPDRITHDCDVLGVEPDEAWKDVAAAAADVAERLGYPPDWLNRDSRMYAHLLPLGWQRRCIRVGRFGPMEVDALGRADLIAAKVMAAPKRPEDLTDLAVMKPNRRELRQLRKHLDRLESESLARDEFDLQRMIVDDMENRL